jgi:hypothetical protein
VSLVSADQLPPTDGSEERHSISQDACLLPGYLPLSSTFPPVPWAERASRSRRLCFSSKSHTHSSPSRDTSHDRKPSLYHSSPSLSLSLSLSIYIYMYISLSLSLSHTNKHTHTHTHTHARARRAPHDLLTRDFACIAGNLRTPPASVTGR